MGYGLRNLTHQNLITKQDMVELRSELKTGIVKLKTSMAKLKGKMLD